MFTLTLNLGSLPNKHQQDSSNFHQRSYCAQHYPHLYEHLIRNLEENNKFSTVISFESLT